MTKISEKLAGDISSKLGFDEEKQAVIEYGLEAMLQMLMIFALISIFGILFGFWYEVIALFLGTGILRKYTGGAHSESFWGCFAVSVCVITLLGLISVSFRVQTLRPYILVAQIISFALVFYIVNKKAPVDSLNKPITRPEKIARLRKGAFVVSGIYALLAVSCVLLSGFSIRLQSVSVSLTFAAIWQTLMLTKAGAKAMLFFDHKIVRPCS